MTRAEALKRLEGTWCFDLVGNRVLIRELSLLSAVDALRRERADASSKELPQLARVAPLGAAASGD